MVRVFSEQFVDNNGKAELNPHPGGKILLNPSDPEAEIGHKGVGYQVQIAETCSDENYVKSAENGVKLIAPTAHQPKDKVGLNECKFDEKKCIVECSAGKKPFFRKFKNGKGRAVFFQQRLR